MSGIMNQPSAAEFTVPAEPGPAELGPAEPGPVPDGTVGVDRRRPGRLDIDHPALIAIMRMPVAPLPADSFTAAPTGFLPLTVGAALFWLAVARLTGLI